jgi:hypothetical protein
MRPSCPVPLIDSRAGNSSDHPVDRLRCDAQIGQFGQITRCLLIGDSVDSGVDNLLLYTRAKATMVNAPATDSDGKKRPTAGAIPDALLPLDAASGRCQHARLIRCLAGYTSADRALAQFLLGQSSACSCTLSSINCRAISSPSAPATASNSENFVPRGRPSG